MKKTVYRSKIFCIILLSLTATTHVIAAINPDKTIYYPFLTLNSYKLLPNNAQVSGLKYSKYNKKFISRGRKFKVPKDEFKMLKKLSRSVYPIKKTSSGDYIGPTTLHTRVYYGSAFHVGGKLMLTAQHVLSPNRKNTTKCDGFSIQAKVYKKTRTFRCKKVHYCNIEKDFCLIEMKNHRKGYSLKNLPSLTLNANYEWGDEVEHYAIGNPDGLGIHASKGVELYPFKNLTVLQFFAPIHKGNSGGPLLNTAGEVIGLVIKEQRELDAPNSYLIESSLNFNIATPIGDILKELKSKISNRDLLRQIKLKKDVK